MPGALWGREPQAGRGKRQAAAWPGPRAAAPGAPACRAPGQQCAVMTTLFTDGLPRRPLAQLCITGSRVGAGFHVFVIKRHPARSERGGWMGVGGSRAHPRRAVSPRQPLGSQLGQSSAPLQAHPCPPFHGPYVDGVSQRPGKCLVFHQAGGKRLARLPLRLASPPCRRRSPSQRAAAPHLRAHCARGCLPSPSPARQVSQVPYRPGIAVDIILRMAASAKDLSA